VRPSMFRADARQPLIHRAVAPGLERDPAPHGFSHAGSCAAYQQNEQVMKALELAATAATFAAIFSALMLCGAALTATLHKAIASVPVAMSLS